MKPVVAVMMRTFQGGPDDPSKVRNPVRVFEASKHALLYFDKIAPYYVTFPGDKSWVSERETAKATVLLEQAHLWYDSLNSLKISPRKHPRAHKMLENLAQPEQTKLTTLDAQLRLFDDLTRVLSCALSEQENVEAIPILFGRPDAESLSSVADAPVTKNDVLRFVIEAMPKPSLRTPLEAIVDFRADPDTHRKLRRLRRWMRKMAESGGSSDKIADELEALLDDYESHMKLHRMKVEHGFLETVVTTTAEVLEDISKLRFGKLAKMPFAVKHAKIALLEAEQKAPGREIAYIAEARRALGWRRFF